MAMQPMQPAAFVAMPEGFQAMPHGMHPEMMQGMQGMPMQVVMGPMGPMMAGPMPPAMMPPGAMGAPQLTQMLVDAARGGRSSNVFFKTRICNKWRSGSCPYGDKCTYAHGEHELRYVPPEIVAQLEAQQKLQEPGQGQQRSGGVGGAEAHQQRAEDSGGGAIASGGGGGPGGHQSFYKTRLCIKYMQTGYCHKAASCTFAHGYEDLRQPGTPMSPGHMPQDSMSPPRMGMAPGGMPMMPAGMMGMAMAAPPGAPMGAGRGMHLGPAGAMHMPVPVPMPGSSIPPPGRYTGQQQQQAQRSPRAGGGCGGYGGSREDPATAARRRATAMCQIAGVGEVGAEEPNPAAVQAAMSDVRSGAAYRDSAYADSVADLVQGQGQGQARQAGGATAGESS